MCAYAQAAAARKCFLAGTETRRRRFCVKVVETFYEEASRDERKEDGRQKVEAPQGRSSGYLGREAY